MKIDFREFARSIAERDSLQSLQPVIEKELVHFEILRSLSNHGLLDRLTLQGGTSLRLFYGSERYSEDLDFTAGDFFSELDIDAFSSALRNDLLNAYDVEVRVKEPKLQQEPGNITMKRWTVVVNTAPRRKDLPSQRIKMEIASVPSYSSEMRQIIPSYPGLPSHYSRILVKCQKLEEVLADKLISLANAEGHVRYRDLWDIPWLTMRPEVEKADVSGYFERKWSDYGCSNSLAALIAVGRKRAMTEIESDAFAGQMRRFLPSDVYEHTVSSFDYRNLMLGRIVKAYDSLTCALNLEAQVRQEWLSLSDVAQAPKYESRMVRGKTI